MGKSVLFAFLIVIIVGLVSFSTVHFSSAQNSTLYEISGYILDSKGNGISGARIIFNVPSVVPSVHSDSSGNYVLYAPTGTYHITVWPPFDSNYINYDESAFVVDSHKTKNITLESGHKVSGHISDSSGNAVEGAVVSLNGFLSGYYSNYLGYYFVNVPTGTYDLNVKPRAGYDHFSSYFESNFKVNGDTTKNITVSDHSPSQYTTPDEPYSPPPPVKWEPLLDPLPQSTSTIWNRTFGGKPYENAESVIETSDGGFAIAGWVWSPSAMMLVKTDKFGNVEWVKAYRKSDFDWAMALVETSDGGYALAGYSRPFEDRGHDFWLVKTDAYGNMEWNQLYGGAGADRPEVLIETSDGGFVLCGRKGLEFFYSNVWLIKTDSFGNMEWNQTYSEEEIFRSGIAVEASDGGFVLASAGLIMKIDELGNMEWNQTCPVTSSLVRTSDGGYALAGGDSLVKTDATGNMEWNRTFEGTEIHSINSLAVTSDGGYVLAGFYGSVYEPGQADFWVIKTNEHGYIPEFPSLIVLPLVITTTLLILIYKKRLPKKHQNQKKSFILGD